MKRPGFLAKGKPRPPSAGKTSQAEKLPSRHSRASVTKGDQFDRMMGRYGKKPKAPPMGGFGY